MKAVFSVLVCLVSFPVLGGELPELVLPAGVGVNIHFDRGHERDLDLIAAAGFKFVRMDFAWGAMERKKGEYDWSAYEELTRNLEKRGLRALYILDYSNSLYEATVVSRNPVTGRDQADVASPQHPESVAAFARWAAAGASHFRGRHIVWEIWNEPNISFWKPKPDVRQYTELALATCRAIREADGEATIIAPATSAFAWTFLESFLASGVLEYLDGVSVHPYRKYSLGPETAAEDYRKLRGLIEKYAPSAAKKKLPIVSGEWGYATDRKGVSLQTQGAYIARQQLSNLLAGVPLSIWYDWRDDGPDPNEREHNFGTVTTELKPKPAYVAVQTLTRELGGYRMARRLAMGSEKDYVLECVHAGGEQKLAAWTLGEPHTITIKIRSGGEGRLSGVRGSGEAYAVKVERDRLVLDLSESPVYLALGGVKLQE